MVDDQPRPGPEDGPSDGTGGDPGDGPGDGPGDEAWRARLREIWEERDPVPPGLVDRVITNLAIAGLDEDIELLRLLESASLTGTRSQTEGSGGAISRFGASGVTVLLHLTGSGEDDRVLVGWIDPPQRAAVSLVTPGGASEVIADESGRFEFAASAGDRARIVLTLDNGRMATHVMEF